MNNFLLALTLKQHGRYIPCQGDKTQPDPNQLTEASAAHDLSLHYEALHPYALFLVSDSNPMPTNAFAK